MAKDKTNTDSIFNSVDFQKFLHDNNNALSAIKKRRRSTSTSSNISDYFKSKESNNIFKSTDLFKSTNLFKSAESISDIFKSKDSFSNLFSSLDFPQMAAAAGDIPALSIMNTDQDNSFRSRDWMSLQNLGDHVDVSYTPQELFNSSEGSDNGNEQQAQQEQAAPSYSSNKKTDWENFFLSQLHPPAATAMDEDYALRIPAERGEQFTAIKNTTAKSAKKTRKKKQTASRKKTTEANSSKEYVVNPGDLDVLLGRGGKSNHHPGNKRYREEIKNFQTSYLQLTNKEDKTDLTRCVVNYVHEYNGRFLALDKDVNMWYVVPDVIARRKVSQALREDDDPVKRKEKRDRYLKKKAMANTGVGV